MTAIAIYAAKLAITVLIIPFTVGLIVGALNRLKAMGQL